MYTNDVSCLLMGAVVCLGVCQSFQNIWHAKQCAGDNVNLPCARSYLSSSVRRQIPLKALLFST